jgi:beta-galactosidase
MVHGGTNFAFTAGANYDKKRDIQPDLTSYDYDAPISEAGWVTPKYDSIRNVIQQYVKHRLPEPPARIPVIEIPSIRLEKVADLLSYTERLQPVTGNTPMTFEQLEQGYGYVLYTRRFNQPISGTLSIPGLRDYAVVYIDGEQIGVLNRNTQTYDIDIEIPFNATLQILVENMGRINYGDEVVNNNKGIISPVTINDQEIMGNWEMFGLPMSEMPELSKMGRAAAKNSPSIAKRLSGCPVLYEGTFTLDETGDTFIDMSAWGKGIVFVNGHNLGRFWQVGPQQTLYLPGVWLNKGENKIVIFEQLNETPQTTVSTIKKPILDDLR